MFQFPPIYTSVKWFLFLALVHGAFLLSYRAHSIRFISPSQRLYNTFVNDISVPLINIFVYSMWRRNVALATEPIICKELQNIEVLFFYLMAYCRWTENFWESFMRFFNSFHRIHGYLWILNLCCNHRFTHVYRVTESLSILSKWSKMDSDLKNLYEEKLSW